VRAGGLSGGVVTRPVPPALAPFVASLGYAEVRCTHARELAMPTGTTQLLVNLDRDALHTYDPADPRAGQRTGGAALQGASASPALIDPAEQRAVLWVSFRVGGAYPFFAGPATETRDQLVDLDALWGRDAALLRERLLGTPDPAARLALVERALLARRPDLADRDPAVAFAAAALDRGAPVADVADRLGWTPRRLGRAFAARIGLPPKRFARVRRFQRLLAAVAAAPDLDWARLAAECGYHDQPHLIHEFRALAGITPAGYAPRSPADRNHVPIPTIRPDAAGS
jgi:AraC-like DNA-binding protein